MIYYLYMLNCSNGALYTGFTTDMVRRYAEHCAGSPKCKYTRSFPPLKIAACWQFEGERAEILRLESAVKRCNKREKELLLLSFRELTQRLSKKGLSLDLIERLQRIEDINEASAIEQLR